MANNLKHGLGYYRRQGWFVSSCMINNALQKQSLEQLCFLSNTHRFKRLHETRNQQQMTMGCRPTSPFALNCVFFCSNTMKPARPECIHTSLRHFCQLALSSREPAKTIFCFRRSAVFSKRTTCPGLLSPQWTYSWLVCTS